MNTCLFYEYVNSKFMFILYLPTVSDMVTHTSTQ